ncbi:bactofilin family protein [Natranaerobius trueperi]|uniref:Cell shape determination protein CcmA n=1 Tax=Natranaerobius trueperi TaxID=759412 RepID=A0A226BWV8_9FIRM|nr:polymer-forming cytoskeletal protein [Natranaerobius trueperi]OWZ83486.1 cell shape determination protein CcmA [Natranaerobius trueperi]
MFNKKEKAQQLDKVETIIGNATEFKGNISSEGMVRIDGSVEGEIAIGDSLVIGEQGKVYANIKSKNVTVAGEIHGDVECTESLEILSSGKLYGNIKVTNLFIDDGATFEGNCEMKQSKENEKVKKNESP